MPADRSDCDLAVIGAGIVGLATALRLLERAPDLRITILEKERQIASHQTGHNSGVLHAGLYYATGSLKAQLCRTGKRQIEAFAASHEIPVMTRGKLVVAVDESERPRLLNLYERAVSNQVPGVELLSARELHGHEPKVVGVAAVWSPTTGVIDFRKVAEALAADLVVKAVAIQTGVEVTGLVQQSSAVVLQTTAGDVVARNVIAC